MFVLDMLCDWLRSQGKIKNPSWEQIRDAIKELDARQRTEVSIAGPGEAHMSICGGNGTYLVSATLNNDVFFDIVNPDGSDEDEVSFVAGGQRVTSSMDEVVPLDVALRAAQTFAETGVIDTTLRWSRNPPEDDEL